MASKAANRACPLPGRAQTVLPSPLWVMAQNLIAASIRSSASSSAGRLTQQSRKDLPSDGRLERGQEVNPMTNESLSAEITFTPAEREAVYKAIFARRDVRR